MTSNEILEEIRERFAWKLAALMTLLARMADKGYVYCDRSTRTNYYSAVVSQDEYKTRESESFLEKLYDNSATKLIAHLYESRKISAKEVDELRRYLDSIGGD